MTLPDQIIVPTPHLTGSRRGGRNALLVATAESRADRSSDQDDGICRWLRRHDCQPPSGANDIGRMEFDTPDRVLEYGVKADYFEISFGRWDSGTSTGRIELSTLPWKQGTTISISGS